MNVKSALIPALSFSALTLLSCGAPTASVSWTVDGITVEEGGCQEGDQVRISAQLTGNGEEGSRSIQATTDCSTGSAEVEIATRATLTAELIRNDVTVAAAGPLTLSSTQIAEGTARFDLVSTITNVTLGFSFAQQNCSEAGVSSVDVVVRRRLISNDFEEFLSETVNCDGGDERLIIENQPIGTRLRVSATATGGDTNFAAPSQEIDVSGQGVTETLDLRAGLETE